MSLESTLVCCFFARDRRRAAAATLESFVLAISSAVAIAVAISDVIVTYESVDKNVRICHEKAALFAIAFARLVSRSLPGMMCIKASLSRSPLLLFMSSSDLMSAATASRMAPLCFCACDLCLISLSRETPALLAAIRSFVSLTSALVYACFVSSMASCGLCGITCPVPFFNRRARRPSDPPGRIRRPPSLAIVMASASPALSGVVVDNAGSPLVLQ